MEGTVISLFFGNVKIENKKSRAKKRRLNERKIEMKIVRSRSRSTVVQLQYNIERCWHIESKGLFKQLQY